MQTLRILLYNIDHGGREGQKSQARWPKIIRIIKNVNPDIVILLEAWGWKKNKELKTFNQHLKFPYTILSHSNTPHHIALLSRLRPRGVKIYKRGFHHSLITAIFESTSGLFAVFAIHLSPKTETKRLREAKKILRLAKSFPRAVIAGDYNSLSPLDRYNVRKLIRALRQNKIKKFGTRKIHRQVITLFQKYGYFDALKRTHTAQRLNPTVPTKKATDKAHVIPMRLDYAFVSKSIVSNIVRAQIIKNPLTDVSSDHYPLFLELKERNTQ